MPNWGNLSAALALLAAGGLFTSAAPAQETELPRLQSITERPIPWQSDWTMTGGPGQDWSIAWHGWRPELMARVNGESIISLIEREDTEQAPSGLGLAQTVEGVWVGYRNKMPERGVYVERVGHQERVRPINISEDALPLARLQLHAHQDQIRATWYGERRGDNGTEYHIHYREFSKDGDLGAQHANLLPGIYPVWINDPSGRMAIFSWVVDQDGSRIETRRRLTDGGFDEAATIRETSREITLPFGSFISGNRWFVYWVAQYGGGSDYLIEGAYSDDYGKSWTDFDLEAMRGLGIESVAVEGDGERITVALGVEDPSHPRRGHSTVKIIQSEDNGKTWGDLQSVRDEEAFGYARSRSPHLARLDDDHLLLIWEDWREIRSRVRYSLSSDGGKTWDVRDGRLAVGDEHNVMLNLSANAIQVLDDGRVLIAKEYMQDPFDTKMLKVMHTDLASLGQPDSELKPTTDDLKARQDAYWEAMINEDFRAGYELLDPFYRARIPFREHLRSMGRVEYEEAEIKDMEAQGHVAMTRSRVRAGVPEFSTEHGETVTVPMDDRSVDLRWVWVDGDWYVEYFSEGRGGIRFTRH